MSVGLQPSHLHQSAFTIPLLVQRIVDRLENANHYEFASEFVSRVSMYGAESGFGYNHLLMSKDAPFTNAYAMVFMRSYNMADPDIKVLRHDDVDVLHHVEPHSVSFRVNLPDAISIDNPVPGMNAVVKQILHAE